MGCGKFEFKDHLEEQVLSVGTENISLKEISYYIMERENYYNQQAKVENPHDPSKYWEDYFLTAGTYFRNWVKEQAYDMCICDNIYYQDAQLNGYELDLTEQIEAYEEANKVFDKMSKKQKSATELTVDDLYEIMLKISIRAKYANDVLDNMDEDMTTEEKMTAIEVNGVYYQEVLSRFTVTINSELWDQIELGKITIN